MTIDDDDQDLHVPTQAVWLELSLAGRPPHRAMIFVPPHQGVAAPRQRDVAALLEGDAAFFPVREEGDQTPVVCNKATLVWVALNHDVLEGAEDIAAEDDALADQHHEVRVELVDGQRLAGAMIYGAPAERQRVVDHLNTRGRFFRLWTPDRLYLINKTHVERVVETPIDLDDKTRD